MSIDPDPKDEDQVERHLMIAVDSSENAKRAVQFVGDFFGCYTGFRVTLLHVILEPEPGYFGNEKERRKWVSQHQTEAETMLDEYARLLADSGFLPEKVARKVTVSRGSSVAEIIMKEQESLSCCTITIGRRGLSKKEEFIFGSTSNKLLHSASNCAVLVVE